MSIYGHILYIIINIYIYYIHLYIYSYMKNFFSGQYLLKEKLIPNYSN